MKIVTANGKKTVKMSKTDWMNIGKKAGWSNQPRNPQNEIGGPNFGYPNTSQENAFETPQEIQNSTKLTKEEWNVITNAYTQLTKTIAPERLQQPPLKTLVDAFDSVIKMG